jgi:xanthosine utilization system XapX-like protein
MSDESTANKTNAAVEVALNVTSPDVPVTATLVGVVVGEAIVPAEWATIGVRTAATRAAKADAIAATCPLPTPDRRDSIAAAFAASRLRADALAAGTASATDAIATTPKVRRRNGDRV